MEQFGKICLSFRPPQKLGMLLERYGHDLKLIILHFV